MIRSRHNARDEDQLRLHVADTTMENGGTNSCPSINDALPLGFNGIVHIKAEPRNGIPTKVLAELSALQDCMHILGKAQSRESAHLTFHNTPTVCFGMRSE